MIEWDKSSWRGQLPASVSKYKAFFVFGVVVMWGLGALYTFVVNIVLGFPIHRNSPFPVTVFVVYALAVICVNQWLLGPEKRVEYYREIFDGWDKQKHLRWTLYVTFIAISMLLIFFFVVQASRPMLVP
jgi:hypothetical protein